MKLSDIMGAAGLSIYAEIALALFLGSFVAVAWSVRSKRNQPTWEAARFIPLSDEEPRENRASIGENA